MSNAAPNRDKEGARHHPDGLYSSENYAPYQLLIPCRLPHRQQVRNRG